MNIETKFLEGHLNHKRSSGNEFGVIILKPDCPEDEKVFLSEFASANGLRLLSESERGLTKQEVIALYPESFSYSNNDLEFGIDWKLETIAYMTSGKCACYLFEGEDAVRKLVSHKYAIRGRHGKVTRPEAPLSKDEFNERVVRNLAHTADAGEVQNVIWLLFT